MNGFGSLKFLVGSGLLNMIKELDMYIQGIRKRWMQGFLPKKSPSIFSCLDLILWPNVSNIFGDDFVPHHLVFYEIF